MSGKRRLKANAPRLLGRHDGPDGRAYRRAYDALEADLGPFASELVRFEAGRAAVTMVNLEGATKAQAAARRARESGKGRRPGPRDLERLARRQGLADATYSQALDKLRELAQRNGHPRGGRAPLTSDRLLAELAQDAP
ncbi:MAG: hypothetical protein HY553_08375 [Elusimicrobia bacterium]|nr:hypothetical protein [Elusimicrobiota bacterium]